MLEPPLQSIANGSAAGVDLVTGTTQHEMTLFNLLDPTLADADVATITARLERVVGDRAADIVAGYQWRRRDATAVELWTDISSDVVFRMPAIDLAEAQLGHGRVWMYLFAWETPALDGALKSCHALELPFVFDTLDRPGTEFFTGTGVDRAGLATAMHKAWIAFARTGEPRHDGIPAWYPYDFEARTMMRFDSQNQIIHDWRAKDRLAWMKPTTP
jgi:para-nitrobenzyl esterase